MIRWRTKTSLAIASALAISVLPGFSATAAAPAEDESELAVQNVPVTLSSPVDLSTAIDAGTKSGKDIVGYRFENDFVVGEYFPDGENPNEFLQQFYSDFGMEPRIVSIVEQIEVPAGAKPEIAVSPDVLQVPQNRSAEQKFTSSRTGTMWEQLAESKKEADERGLIGDTSAQAGLTEQNFQADGDQLLRGTAVTLSWEPTFSRFGLRNVGSNPQKASIFQEYTWSEPGYSPLFRDLNTAMEFEINQHNETPLLWGGIRPNCIANYREHFWATNSGYTWGVFSPYGFASVGIGAYADTNDWSDPCARQSMAIGVSNPGNVLDDGTGFTQLALWITANRGAVASESRISGVVQAVEKLSCNAWPWNGDVVTTDCVGLDQGYSYNGYGPSHFTTLNGETRTVWAPEKCWMTSREAMQWDPNEGPSQVYFGSCNDRRFQGANATPSLGGCRGGFVGSAVYRVLDASLGCVGAEDSSAVSCEYGSGRGMGKASGHGHSHGCSRRYRAGTRSGAATGSIWHLSASHT